MLPPRVWVVLQPRCRRAGDCAGDGIDYVWGCFGWLGWVCERECRAYGGAGEW
jgi:hypothetical protein